MSESQIRKCAYCEQSKPWIWNGKKLKDGSKIYVDQKGTRWAGRRCPQCEKSRVQQAIKCDTFDRSLIFSELEQKGFTINSRSLPITAEKDGQIIKIGVKRAATRDGKITLESDLSDDVDMIALVFESVRLCSVDQLQKISSTVEVFTGASSHD